MTIDAGGVKLTAILAPVVGGTYATPVGVFGTNRLTDRPAPHYVSQVTINTGGTATGGTVVETIRTKVGNGANATSNNGSTNGERLLPAGDYYLKLESIDAGTSTGVYSLRWEERPSGME